MYDSRSGIRPVPEPPEEMRGKSKKDTRKWCKGVVGREHAWETIPTHPEWPDWKYIHDHCTVCGKCVRLRTRSTTPGAVGVSAPAAQ